MYTSNGEQTNLPIFHKIPFSFLMGVSWAIGLFGLYHLFTFTRQYFEGLQTFDMVLLLLALLGCLLITWKYRATPQYIMIIGLFGVSFWSIMELFTFPILPNPDDLAPIMIFGVLSEQGMIGFVGIMSSMILILSSLIQFIVYHDFFCLEKTYSSSKNTQSDLLQAIILGLVIAVCLYLLFSEFAPQNIHNVFYTNGLLGAIGLVLIASNFPALKTFFSSEERKLINQLKTYIPLTKSTNIWNFLFSFISWVIYSLILIALTFFYNQFMLENDCNLTVNYLITSIGLGVIVVVLLLNFKIIVFLRKIFFLIGGVIFMVIFYRTNSALSDRFYFSSLNIIFGLAFIFFLISYLVNLVPYSLSKTHGILLALTIILMGYVANIPAHYEEVESMSSLMDNILVWLLVGELVLMLVRYRVSPNLNQIYDYLYRTKPAIEKRRNTH